MENYKPYVWLRKTTGPMFEAVYVVSLPAGYRHYATLAGYVSGTKRIFEYQIVGDTTASASSSEATTGSHAQGTPAKLEVRTIDVSLGGSVQRGKKTANYNDAEDVGAGGGGRP